MDNNVWFMKTTVSTEVMLSAVDSYVSVSLSEISNKASEYSFLFVILNTKISARDKGSKISVYV